MLKPSTLKLIFSVIFYALVLISYNYYSYNNYKKEEISKIDEKLKLSAYSVYYLLGEEFFLKATTESAISKEEDWKNIQLLTSYNDKAKLGFVYASIKKDGKIYLISSSASKEELEKDEQLLYFHDYDSAKKLVQAFDGDEITYEIYSDNWGDFRAVHIPMTLKNNHKFVVSSEISLSSFHELLNEIKYKYFLEALLHLLITIPIIITVTQVLLANKKLELLSYYDKLTNIANRRAYDERIKIELASSKRLGTQLSLFMIDIDFFKQYNDNYGHAKGDIALNRVARCISNTLERQSDFVARYGGEEFVVILPNTPIESAAKVADDIISNILAKKIEHDYSTISSYLTVSIGISSTKIGFNNLVEQADEALYMAKKNGKNRYHIARSL